MNQKNLSARNKTHKKILDYLKDKKILQIYKSFEKSINISEVFAVAVSGGPDSLSLAFLAKNFAIKKKLNAKFYIVDHKLRKNSSIEAHLVKKKLKEIGINSKILNWYGKKPNSNIQSLARNKRYSLLFKECKKNKITNLLLGHHLDDLFENFFIRFLRGSGLKGLISFDKNSVNNKKDINILRPLLDIEKKDLIYLSKKVFDFFIADPSNQDDNFKRVRVRNFLSFLEKEGLDKKKFLLTIDNLKDSDATIKHYTKYNIEKNSIYLKKKNIAILNKEFFYQSHEVIFRSFSNIIGLIGKKYYPIRGKSVNTIISKILCDTLTKVTLGGCFIEKTNQSIIISKEN
jgi:tRNA(Ile)-lysidine synthase